MPTRHHQHNLMCIEPVNSTNPKLQGRLYFCKTMGKFIEGDDPNTHLKNRLLLPIGERLREIADKHGLTLHEINEISNEIQTSGGWRPRERHPAIDEAWKEMPGHYSYSDTVLSMGKALRGEPI